MAGLHFVWPPSDVLSATVTRFKLGLDRTPARGPRFLQSKYESRRLGRVLDR